MGHKMTQAPVLPLNELIISLADAEHLNTFSLVLLAADIPHRIRIVLPTQMEIYVALPEKEKALKELSAYSEENAAQPVNSNELPAFTPIFQAMSPLVIGCLACLYGVSGDWQPQGIWFNKGTGDSTAILRDHEFFRLVTALTLHADIVHLLSNCILGLFLLHFLLLLTGNGIGLFAVFLTSVSANYINVLIRGPGHLFVGFSTSIFSIIGMLCTISFASKTKRLFFHFFMPIMAGLALLALLGSEGVRTDLGSHLFGLFSGLIGGNLVRLPYFNSWRSSFYLQLLLVIVTFLLVYGSWLLAFSQ